MAPAKSTTLRFSSTMICCFCVVTLILSVSLLPQHTPFVTSFPSPSLLVSDDSPLVRVLNHTLQSHPSNSTQPDQPLPDQPQQNSTTTYSLNSSATISFTSAKPSDAHVATIEGTIEEPAEATNTTRVVTSPAEEYAEEELPENARPGVVEVMTETRKGESPLERSYPRLTGNAKCVVYDRPPRTGSTTISRAITDCMQSKQYLSPKAITRALRHEVIPRMLERESELLCAVSTHMYMTTEDVEAMGKRCGDLLYITGCAPIKERLYSAAKYAASEADNENTTVGMNEMEEMEKYLKFKNEEMEWELENYPYVISGAGVAPEKRVVPDYVIRKEFVDDDLSALLTVLGCPVVFTSDNVHEASSELGDRFMEVVNAPNGDGLYRWLKERAKWNGEGLKKAARF